MERAATMALLATGSYWDIRKGDSYDPAVTDNDNRAPIPDGWRLLPEDASYSGDSVFSGGSGFSARAYKNIYTGEIVISYAGTEAGNNTKGTAQDFLSGNIPLAGGIRSEQGFLAAQFYQLIKNKYATSDITFTGHSLGGGLASLMSAWFDRPAYVYAPAPFELSANKIDLFKTILEKNLEFSLSVPKSAIDSVRERLGDSIDNAFKIYDPSLHYSERKSNVKSWAVKGEILETIEPTAHLINSLSPIVTPIIVSAIKAIGGPIAGDAFAYATKIFLDSVAELVPHVKPIEEGRTHLFTEIGDAIGAVAKHSIDLHAAALMVPQFEQQMNKIPAMLELIFNEKLYGHAVTSNQQNFLVKLIRNEAGIRANDGSVL